jgi:hypothetical protein
MKSKRRWFFGLALTFPLVILLLVLSSMQLASADTGQSDVPHWFYGHLVDDGGGPLPAGAVVEARDDAGGVIWTGIKGNPITTEDDGVYGCKDPDDPSITDINLAVQGAAEDMYEGLPISFYVNGVRARGIRPCGSDEWLMDAEAVWPWKSNRETCLDIMGGEVDYYQLTVDASAGCYSVTVSYGTVITVVEAGEVGVFDVLVDATADLEVFPDNDCCTWEGWSDGVTETVTSVLMDTPKTIVANSTLEEYWLTINQEGDGTVLPYVGTQLQPCGETVVVTATADPGPPPWSFEGWTGDLSGAAEIETILMDADKEITATFNLGIPTPLTVTATGCYSIEVVGKGIVAGGTTDVFTVTSGSAVELATVGTCCDLNAWFIDGVDVGNADPYIFTMPVTPTTVTDDSNGPPFTLAIGVDGEGGGDVDPFVGEQGGYVCGEVVTLTATPLVSSTFAGWTGDLVSALTETLLVIDEDLVVTATFDLRELGLEDVQYPTETVTPEPGPPWTWGDTVTFTADLISGCFEFSGWSGALAGQPNPAVVQLEGPFPMVFAPIYDQVRIVTLTTFTDTFGGPGSVTPAAGVYTCGEVVTLTAAPTQTFLSWEGDWAGEVNPDAVLMDNDRVITAVFGFDPDSMVITIDPPGGEIAPGETLTFTVTVTDDMGNEGDVTSDATFTTTGGTVDENGVYTPPPGVTGGETFKVCVTYQGKQKCVWVTIEGGVLPFFVGQVEAGDFASGMGVEGITLWVRIDGTEVTATVKAGGLFTLTTDDFNVAGDYQICVKENRSLAMCALTVTLPSVDVPTNFGPIVAGDTDMNDTVGFDDLLTLAALWGQSGHLHVDFNNSGDGPDFNDLLVLAANWGKTGDGW